MSTPPSHAPSTPMDERPSPPPAALPLEDAFGNPVLDPLGNPLLLQTTEETVSRTVVVTQRTNLGVALQGRRTDYSLNALRSVRESELGGSDETVLSMNAIVNRRLSRKTSATVDANWQRSEFGSADNRRTIWSMGLRLSHQIAPGWSGSVLARRTQTRTVPAGNSEFTENRVAATVRASF